MLGIEAPLEAIGRLELPSFMGSTLPVGPGSVEPETPLASATRSKQGRKEEREKKEDPPFVLSEALPVVPAKLVRRILRAEYVDMAELLRDNMEAEKRRMMVEGSTNQGHFANRPSRREVPDVLSWLQCFTLYAAVVASEYPGKMRELLAYQAMIINEARRSGGRGWLLYDTAFRQQIVSFEAVDFSKINQSLYSTTILVYGSVKPRFCPDYMMADHAHEDCALHPNRSLPVVQMRDLEGRQRGQEPRRKRGRIGPCYAWNEGKCHYQQCRYEHLCSHCLGEHRKANCKWGGGERLREAGPPGR